MIDYTGCTVKWRPNLYSSIMLMSQDLINCTPTSHADYDPLQKTLIITQQFLENLDDESSDIDLLVRDDLV